jgi:hypothetical protein
MTPNMNVSKVSGVPYAYAANGGNLGAPVSALNKAPTAATSYSERVKRSHLRLVRD